MNVTGTIWRMWVITELLPNYITGMTGKDGRSLGAYVCAMRVCVCWEWGGELVLHPPPQHTHTRKTKPTELLCKQKFFKTLSVWLRNHAHKCTDIGTHTFLAGSLDIFTYVWPILTQSIQLRAALSLKQAVVVYTTSSPATTNTNCAWEPSWGNVSMWKLFGTEPSCCRTEDDMVHEHQNTHTHTHSELELEISHHKINKLRQFNY